jgi:N-acetylglucosamine kinase-like BadF-type ATPase
MTKPFFIGIDAGGTKTLLMAATSDRSRELTLTDSAINLYRTNRDEAFNILLRLIQQACHNLPDLTLAGVCAGISGAGNSTQTNAATPEVQHRLSEALNVPIQIINDAPIALEGAFEHGSGILTIVGTGSNVLGRTRDKQLVQTGGWGYLLGDEGSGMVIGLQGLRALVADLEAERPSLLRRLLAERLQIENRSLLLEYVYRSQKPIQHIAPLVLEAAQGGDHAARNIAETQAEGICKQIQRLAIHHEEALDKQVAFIGGLYNNALYAELLRKNLAELLPEWQIVKAKHSPVIGAWRMAQPVV